MLILVLVNSPDGQFLLWREGKLQTDPLNLQEGFKLSTTAALAAKADPGGCGRSQKTILPIAKEIHQSTQSLAARYTLGWPQPGAAELALSQELLTNYKSRQMRRRISSPSHKRGHCGAGRERARLLCHPAATQGRDKS